MLGNKNPHGARQGNELAFAMAVGGEPVVAIDLFHEVAQRDASIGRYVAYPLPNQRLKVDQCLSSTNADAVLFSHVD